MARYDRIARLSPPCREDTFGCWMTLRDLEGREREPQLGRRARLRFLALRPLRRLLERGLDRVDGASMALQVEGVREQLASLPSTDAERMRLSEYLQEIGGRAPEGLIRATLDVGAAAEAAGHTYAAEEYYRSAHELAEMQGLMPARIRALRRLGRVTAARREWQAALALYGEAGELAEEANDLVAWALATDGAASAHQRAGDEDTALALLDRIERRGADEGNEVVRAIAAAGRCALHSAAGAIQLAVEAGSQALELFPADDEARYPVLLNLAAGFRRMALREAAESAYSITATRAAWPEHRIEAEVEHAATAAEFGDPEEFGRRRQALMERGGAEDPQMVALLHLGLGRGSMLAGDAEAAREHLRSAISTARDSALDTILSRAEDLLESLERLAAGKEPLTPGSPVEPSAAVRRVADRIATLRNELVAPA